MSFAPAYHKQCLRQQTVLRQILTGGTQHAEAIELFLKQHAMLHSAKLAQAAPWSFEDEIFSDLTDEQVRQIPPRGEHSIVWNIWHIARVEDITMNLLVAGSVQILERDNWLEIMGSHVRHTGNAMDEVGIVGLSARIDVGSLRDYRLAVGRRTREIVMGLSPEALKEKVSPSRVERIMQQGDLLEEAREIAYYWSKRDIAGLLLMPATRHLLVHLNEALQIKLKVK